jgi:hypothetical protein
MVASAFKTTTAEADPLDASAGSGTKPGVSDFLTVQSLTNFAAMTGAITAAWHALQKLSPDASSLWLPYGIAFIWGVISLVMSIDGLRTGQEKELKVGNVAAAFLIAFINSLVLAGAVVGTNIVTTPSR